MATYESVMIYSGDKGQVIKAEEASGTVLDWYENDLIQFNGSGLVTIADASGGVGKIAGIAQARATGTANTAIEIELINPNAIYAIRAQSGVAVAIANVGESWDLNYTKSAHYVNVSSNTNDEIRVVGMYPGEETTQGGRYLVMFNYDIFAQSGA